MGLGARNTGFEYPLIDNCNDSLLYFILFAGCAVWILMTFCSTWIPTTQITGDKKLQEKLKVKTCDARGAGCINCKKKLKKRYFKIALTNVTKYILIHYKGTLANLENKWKVIRRTGKAENCDFIQLLLLSHPYSQLWPPLLAHLATHSFQEIKTDRYIFHPRFLPDMQND